MTNIFNDLDVLSTNDLRVELALLENVNFTNMAKETGNKFVGALAKMATSLIQTVNGDASLDYEVTKMSDIVRKEYQELAGISREQLSENIKNILVQRCVSMSGNAAISDEKASYMVVSEAAKLYDIPKYGTFANKIRGIGIYYNKELLLAVHDMIKKQTPQEAEKLDDSLQKRLDIISLDAKRELSKRIFPKEFSGRGIARVLRLEKGTTYLEIAVSIMGIDCFDAVAAYSGAATGSLKAVNNMRRSVYAQLVWKIYGIQEDTRKNLPSYVNTLKAPEVIAQENEFRQMLKNRIESDKELERLKAQLEGNEQDKEKMLDRLTEKQDKFDRTNEEFDKLQAEKDSYMAGAHPEADTKRYYAHVNAVKRQVDADKAELENTQKKYTDLIAMGKELESTISQREVYNRQLHEQSNKGLQEATGQIKKRWNEFYTRIIFEDDVYGQAVLAFSRDELLRVEQMLLEFMELTDKSAMDTEENVIFCSVSDDGVAKIHHDGKIVTEIVR
jgi:hypothetical protein